MTVRNSATNAGATVAALSVERALGGMRGGVAGLVVQPAVWALTGTTPDAGDAFIYGASAAGVFSSLLAAPAIVVGVVKAAVDDATQTLVDQAKAGEDEGVRDGIYSVGDYSFAASGGHIQAMTIASAGGVAWQHPNGVYLFIKDKNGLPVCDFRPRVFRQIYAPELPLRPVGGGFAWRVLR